MSGAALLQLQSGIRRRDDESGVRDLVKRQSIGCCLLALNNNVLDLEIELAF